MNVLPKTWQGWFGLLPMGLKAWIVFALPILVFCTQRLGADTFPPWLALSETKEVCAPVLTSYFFVGAALFGIGIFELFRRRNKEAVWDFVFVAFALACVQMLEATQHSMVK